jgi:uncharacterized membrane protein
MRVIKTTLIGGAVFLVPVIVILFVLGKAISVMRHVTRPISEMLPFDNIAGLAVANLLALLGVALVCFCAGMLARGPRAKRLYKQLDDGLLMLPGYGLIKSLSDQFKEERPASSPLKPVLVRFDDFEQLCFEVERLADGRVVTFIPGSPDPWSGSLVYLAPERVQQTELSVMQAMSHLRRGGRGAATLNIPRSSAG